MAVLRLQPFHNTMTPAIPLPPQQDQADSWQVGSLQLTSRLIMGSGRYPNLQLMLDSLIKAGTEMVTVAIRRVNLQESQGENLIGLLKNNRYHLLPNTAGCYTVKDAVLTAELAREALETHFVKLELIADKETLYPDIEKLLQAAQELVKLGFEVMPYTIDDPISCKKLEDIGCVAVMPLGAPIGSGMGILNPYNFQLIRRAVTLPVIVDAGIGTASDVVQAMELGCDGVLLDSAVAKCDDPVRMASAMALACLSGRQAFLSGRIPQKHFADASSPSWGMFT